MRKNMQGPVSVGAWLLYLELLKKGFSVSLENPCYSVPIKVGERSVPHTPDIMVEYYNIPVELDGPHHLKPLYEARDVQVDAAYRKAGYRDTERIVFDGGKPSAKRLKEWVGRIEERIRGVS